MGQYYMPISIDKMQSVYSHDYDNGLKLMEHSWIGNNFVNVVENLIAKDGAWHGDKIVWAGDYADSEPNSDPESEENLYVMCHDDKIRPDENKTEYRYLVNLDTQEFVDMTKIPITDTYTDDDGNTIEYRIHPLPLLTCEGNGRGGGDFHGEDPGDLIGTWARNRVIVQNEKPNIEYSELIFDLTE